MMHINAQNNPAPPHIWNQTYSLCGMQLLLSAEKNNMYCRSDLYKLTLFPFKYNWYTSGVPQKVWTKKASVLKIYFQRCVLPEGTECLGVACEPIWTMFGACPLTLIPVRIHGTCTHVLVIRKICWDTRNPQEPLKRDIFQRVDIWQIDKWTNYPNSSAQDCCHS